MEELKKIYTTLVIIKKGNKILLGEKKRGFAKGSLNGIGGKQDIGETNEQAMIRETQEEIGVTPTKFELIGKLWFDMFYKGEHVNMFLTIYMCDEYTGVPVETEEIIPNWYDIEKIPYNRMLKDDILWLPMALNGKKFKGFVKFNENMEMLFHEIKEVEKIEKDNSVLVK